MFCTVFAYDVSSLILIEGKLFPKIAQLCLNKNPKFAIVANSNNEETALKLKKIIKNAKVIFKINTDYDAYIFLNKIKQKELNKLIKNKKLVFSFYPSDIKNAMFSIYIGIRIMPYVNPLLIKKAHLKINPIFFKVGKIYEK
ncbi:hypothetical protein [Caminibacter sp.]